MCNLLQILGFLYLLPLKNCIVKDFQKEDCQKSFTSLDEVGCYSHFVIFYWDEFKKSCIVATYTGCGRTPNNFRTKKECENVAEPICKGPDSSSREIEHAPSEENGLDKSGPDSSSREIEHATSEGNGLDKSDPDSSSREIEDAPPEGNGFDISAPPEENGFDISPCFDQPFHDEGKDICEGYTFYLNLPGRSSRKKWSVNNQFEIRTSASISEFIENKGKCVKFSERCNSKTKTKNYFPRLAECQQIAESICTAPSEGNGLDKSGPDSSSREIEDAPPEENGFDISACFNQPFLDEGKDICEGYTYLNRPGRRRRSSRKKWSVNPQFEIRTSAPISDVIENKGKCVKFSERCNSKTKTKNYFPSLAECQQIAESICTAPPEENGFNISACSDQPFLDGGKDICEGYTFYLYLPGRRRRSSRKKWSVNNQFEIRTSAPISYGIEKPQNTKMKGECILFKDGCNSKTKTKNYFPSLAECQQIAESICTGRCDQDEFMCKNKEKCVNKDFLCDKTEDCKDGSDETEELCGSCTFGFKCKDNGMCIPVTWLCDSYNDCKDGSEEQNCGCIGFQCKSDGQCLPETVRCNKKMDCKDGSDEKDCPCEGFLCRDGTCLNSTKMRCNGRRDCPDGSDEENCINVGDEFENFVRRCEKDHNPSREYTGSLFIKKKLDVLRFKKELTKKASRETKENIYAIYKRWKKDIQSRLVKNPLVSQIHCVLKQFPEFLKYMDRKAQKLNVRLKHILNQPHHDIWIKP